MADARTRTTSWHDPRDVVAALAELDGLEVLERTRAGELPYPPIAATLGMRLVEVEAGHVVWEAEPGEHLYNPIGTVHAGFAVTLLDSAMGTAFVSVATAVSSEIGHPLAAQAKRLSRLGAGWYGQFLDAIEGWYSDLVAKRRLSYIDT